MPGCTDATACNFNPEATLDDDSCEFPADNFDCDGNCIADVDCNGVCGGDATGMRLENVVVTAQKMPMRMASATMWTTALASLTLAACATVLERFTSADVQTFLLATATVMATSSTPWAFAAATAHLMPTATAYVTTQR